MQLDIHQLGCHRGGRPVFAGLTVTLRDGDALLVTGRNGAGKSTLLAAIAGLLRPSSGTIVFDSGDDRPLPECVHHLGHRDGLKAPLTAAENLRAAAALLGAPRSRYTPQGRPADSPPREGGGRREASDGGEDAGRVDPTPDRTFGSTRPSPPGEGPAVVGLDEASALRAVGLAGALALPVAYLSAGQRRRVTLARLLVARRPIWLLDEPTTALDRDGQRMLDVLIAAHRAGGGIVIAATHAPMPLAGARELTLTPAAVS